MLERTIESMMQSLEVDELCEGDCYAEYGTQPAVRYMYE